MTVDYTALGSAALLLILAFISWRWVRAQDDEDDPGAKRDRNAPSVQGIVVNGKSDNGGNPFSSPTCTLYVEYSIGEKDYKGEMEVPLGVFQKYAVPLKRIEQKRVKKGIEPSREDMPAITLFYKKGHPTHIWCQDAVKSRDGKTISFTVLAAAFLLLGLYFGVTAFL